GQCSFVVVDNTDFTTMSDLYRENRLNGKSNFVTADSIVHPYFAFTNGLLARVIQEHMTPELLTMLSSMLKVSAADYKSADDSGVQDDIKRNNALLLVAMRLLDPTLKLPDLGEASKLADAELNNIKQGRIAMSAISLHEEDFSLYQPIGWYNSNAKLRNFYRC